MKKVIYTAMIIALMTGCGKVKTTESVPEKTIKVSTVKVSLSESSNSLRYSGTIEASQTIPLSFQSAGTIQKIYVEVGDIVKKGQLLATTDNSDAQNIYNVTLSKYDQA